MSPKYTINYFINAGTHNLDENQRRLVVIVNLMAFVPALLAFLLGPILYLSTGYLLVLYTAYIEGAIFLAIPWLNRKGRYNMAGMIMFFTHCISTLFFGVILGPVANVEIIVVFLIGLSFLIFQSKAQRAFNLVVLFLSLVVLELNYEYNYLPSLEFSPEAMKVSRLLVLTAVVLLNLLVFYFFSAHFQEWISKLQKKTQQLEAVNRTKSEFLRETSHEIRNPLNVVYRISQELLADVKGHSDGSNVTIPVQRAKALHSASENIMSVINNVLDWSTIENGHLKVEVSPFDWHPLLNNIVHTYQVLADMQNVTLVLETNASLPQTIITDEKILTKALSNLLSNAVKFTAEGSTVRVQAMTDAHRQFVIKVKDEGPGLDSLQQELIFMPYVSERHKRFEGTGLGLPLVKGMVEALEGSITIESQKGQGSTFTIAFPFKTVQKTAETVPPPTPAPVYEKFNNSVVLVVEDDRINQLALGMLLKRTGCIALFATDVLTGIEIAKKHRPNLIIMDMNLPGFSGEEALGMVRANHVLRPIPVITVTGDCFSDTREKMLQAGANGFLTKPVEFNMFYDQLSTLLMHN